MQCRCTESCKQLGGLHIFCKFCISYHRSHFRCQLMLDEDSERGKLVNSSCLPNHIFSIQIWLIKSFISTWDGMV